jgi:hypothetical protein
MFRNAGRARRVRCNECDARFYIASPFSKVAKVIYWLLVAPFTLFLIVVLLRIIRSLFSR